MFIRRLDPSASASASVFCICRTTMAVKMVSRPAQVAQVTKWAAVARTGRQAHELNSTTATLCGHFQVMSLAAGGREVA